MAFQTLGSAVQLQVVNQRQCKQVFYLDEKCGWPEVTTSLQPTKAWPVEDNKQPCKTGQ